MSRRGKERGKTFWPKCAFPSLPVIWKRKGCRSEVSPKNSEKAVCEDRSSIHPRRCREMVKATGYTRTEQGGDYRKGFRAGTRRANWRAEGWKWFLCNSSAWNSKFAGNVSGKGAGFMPRLCVRFECCLGFGVLEKARTHAVVICCFVVIAGKTTEFGRGTGSAQSVPTSQQWG